MKRHVDNVHLNIKFVCPLCKRYLCQKSEMRRHLQSVHFDQLDEIYEPTGLTYQKEFINLKRRRNKSGKNINN